MLLSAEEYRRLKRRDRRAVAVEELPAEPLDRVAKAEMAPRHKKRDRLLGRK